MSKLTRTIKIDADIWKSAKKLAIDKNTNFSQLIEDLLSEEVHTKKRKEE